MEDTSMRLRRVGWALVAYVVVGTLVLAAAPFVGSRGEAALTNLGDSVPTVVTQPPPPPDARPIVTGFEVRGYVSYYRYGDMGFHGGCAAIRDEANWSAFWAVHTAGIWPGPEVPGIDFGEEVVLVCILGTVTDCCGSYVNITAVERDDGGYAVSVDMHIETSMLTMLSNPYHIKAVTRTDGPVRFHLRVAWGPPIPEIPPVP